MKTEDDHDRAALLSGGVTVVASCSCFAVPVERRIVRRQTQLSLLELFHFSSVTIEPKHTSS
jgi:uncharacterized membrane protein YraQ (UPF0718 family)